jgi:hypothetical protein
MTGRFNRRRFPGMSSADAMRTMFLIYLTVIAAGLVGFTLVGLLDR